MLAVGTWWRRGWVGLRARRVVVAAVVLVSGLAAGRRVADAGPTAAGGLLRVDALSRSC